MQTSVTLLEQIRSDGSEELQATCDDLEELVVSLRKIKLKWVEYQDILESNSVVTDVA